MTDEYRERPWVYVAGPYTHGDLNENIRNACHVADKVWDAGFLPIVPHVTQVWDLISPKPVAFWYDYDLHLLAQCDHLIRLPGDSPGADREAVFAIKRRIPCYLGIQHFLDSMAVAAAAPLLTQSRQA